MYFFYQRQILLSDFAIYMSVTRWCLIRSRNCLLFIPGSWWGPCCSSFEFSVLCSCVLFVLVLCLWMSIFIVPLLGFSNFYLWQVSIFNIKVNHAVASKVSRLISPVTILLLKKISKSNFWPQMIVSFGYLYKITEHLNIFNDFEKKQFCQVARMWVVKHKIFYRQRSQYISHNFFSVFLILFGSNKFICRFVLFFGPLCCLFFFDIRRARMAQWVR